MTVHVVVQYVIWSWSQLHLQHLWPSPQSSLCWLLNSRTAPSLLPQLAASTLVTQSRQSLCGLGPMGGHIPLPCTTRSASLKVMGLPLLSVSQSWHSRWPLQRHLTLCELGMCVACMFIFFFGTIYTVFVHAYSIHVYSIHVYSTMYTVVYTVHMYIYCIHVYCILYTCILYTCILYTCILYFTVSMKCLPHCCHQLMRSVCGHLIHQNDSHTNDVL